MKKVFFFFSALLILSSCSKDTESILVINTKPKALYAGESLQLNVSSNDKVSFSVEDEYYASVSSKGLIEAKKVGNTNVKVESKEGIKTFPVVVKAKENLYVEPNLNWNMNSSEVISALGLTKDDVVSFDNAFGIKKYSSNTEVAIFFFDDKTKKLTTYAIYIDLYKLDQAVDFLIERYYAVYVDSDGALFLNSLPKKFKIGTKCISIMLEAKKVNNKECYPILYYKYSKDYNKSFNSEKNMDIHSYEKIYDQILKDL